MGQSGFLIKWQDRGLLFDPYLSDSLTVKYAETDKPHIRMVERVIAPARLNDIIVATSSHNHTDHLDAETLHALLKTNPDLQLVLPEANIEFA
jgi:L-ascorbate metabolism protein UlaG (beta-lactamase superfamily)